MVHAVESFEFEAFGNRILDTIQTPESRSMKYPLPTTPDGDDAGVVVSVPLHLHLQSYEPIQNVEPESKAEETVANGRTMQRNH